MEEMRIRVKTVVDNSAVDTVIKQTNQRIANLQKQVDPRFRAGAKAETAGSIKGIGPSLRSIQSEAEQGILKKGTSHKQIETQLGALREAMGRAVNYYEQLSGKTIDPKRFSLRVPENFKSVRDQEADQKRAAKAEKQKADEAEKAAKRKAREEASAAKKAAEAQAKVDAANKREAAAEERQAKAAEKKAAHDAGVAQRKQERRAQRDANQAEYRRGVEERKEQREAARQARLAAIPLERPFNAMRHQRQDIQGEQGMSRLDRQLAASGQLSLTEGAGMLAMERKSRATREKEAYQRQFRMDSELLAATAELKETTLGTANAQRRATGAIAQKPRVREQREQAAELTREEEVRAGEYKHKIKPRDGASIEDREYEVALRDLARRTKSRSAVSERVIRGESENLALLAQERVSRKRLQMAINKEASELLRSSASAADRGTIGQRAQAWMANRQGLEPRMATEFATGKQRMGQAMMTSATYAASGALLYGAMATLGDVGRQIQETDLAAARLNSQFNALGKGSDLPQFKADMLALARATGIEADEVLRIGSQMMGAFQDTGKAAKQTADILNASILSGLPTTELTDSLTAAAISYGVDIDEISNKAVGLEERFGVEMSESIKAFGDLAAVAETAGLNLDEVGAMLGVVQQRSGVSAAAITEGFSRILPGMEENAVKIIELYTTIPELAGNLGKVQESFNAGQGGQVLLQLIKDSQNLTESQRKMVANEVGGRREAKYVLPLLSGSGDVIKELEDLLSGKTSEEGKAAKRVEDIEKTVTRTLARLKQEFVGIAQALAGAGLLDALIAMAGLVENAAKAVGFLVRTFVALDSKLGGAITKLLGVALAFKTINAAVNALRKAKLGADALGGLTSILAGRGLPVRGAAAGGVVSRVAQRRTLGSVGLSALGIGALGLDGLDSGSRFALAQQAKRNAGLAGGPGRAGLVSLLGAEMLNASGMGGGGFHFGARRRETFDIGTRNRVGPSMLPGGGRIDRALIGMDIASGFAMARRSRAAGSAGGVVAGEIAGALAGPAISGAQAQALGIASTGRKVGMADNVIDGLVIASALSPAGRLRGLLKGGGKLARGIGGFLGRGAARVGLGGAGALSLAGGIGTAPIGAGFMGTAAAGGSLLAGAGTLGLGAAVYGTYKLAKHQYGRLRKEQEDATKAIEGTTKGRSLRALQDVKDAGIMGDASSNWRSGVRGIFGNIGALGGLNPFANEEKLAKNKEAAAAFLTRKKTDSETYGVGMAATTTSTLNAALESGLLDEKDKRVAAVKKKIEESEGKEGSKELLALLDELSAAEQKEINELVTGGQTSDQVKADEGQKLFASAEELSAQFGAGETDFSTYLAGMQAHIKALKGAGLNEEAAAKIIELEREVRAAQAERVSKMLTVLSEFNQISGQDPTAMLPTLQAALASSEVKNDPALLASTAGQINQIARGEFDKSIANAANPTEALRIAQEGAEMPPEVVAAIRAQAKKDGVSLAGLATRFQADEETIKGLFQQETSFLVTQIQASEGQRLTPEEQAGQAKRIASLMYERAQNDTERLQAQIAYDQAVIAGEQAIVDARNAYIGALIASTRSPERKAELALMQAQEEYARALASRDPAKINAAAGAVNESVIAIEDIERSKVDARAQNDISRASRNPMEANRLAQADAERRRRQASDDGRGQDVINIEGEEIQLRQEAEDLRRGQVDAEAQLAITRAARNQVEVNRLGLIDARRRRQQALRDGNTTEATNIAGEEEQLQQEAEDLRRQERDAQARLAGVRDAGNGLRVAQGNTANIRARLTEALNDGNSIDAINLQADLLEAQRAEAEQAYNQADAALGLQEAMAAANGSVVAAVELQVERAQGLVDYLVSQGIDDERLTNAMANLATIQAQAEATKRQDRIGDWEFLYDMERITAGELVSQLEAELALVPLTQKQVRQDLERRIKSLRDEMGKDAAWNLGDITLPTIYEARRLGATRSEGVGYNVPRTMTADNRTISVVNNNYNAQDYEGAVAAFTEAIAAPSRVGVEPRLY